MIRTLASVASLFMFVGGAEAANVTWSVTEGAEGSARRGIWHLKLENGRISGQAQMADRNGQVLSFALVGERRGDEIVLQRSNASDGSHCAYRGRVSADGQATGALICGANRANWFATKQ